MTLRPHFVCAIAAALVCGPARAMEAPEQFADMSLEQLSNIVVTSVSRQETRLGTAAASLYIISASDIRRSGVHSLPEALRLAPNLQVARIDARQYAITARGFNTDLVNKLLVLIDGRSVYSPLFSGVFWDIQDVPLTDIARIEVISGPGATIWGANAVNGVINIITKSAAETQGGLARLRAGESERVGLLRYGGAAGDSGHFRAYAKTVREDARFAPAGHSTRNEYRRSQAGFRADWPATGTGGGGSYTVSGDVVQAKAQRYPAQGYVDIDGANLLGRYTGKLAGGELRLQAIFDHTGRNQSDTIFERLSTLDLEAQHGMAWGRDHKLVWGGGYRHSWDRVRNTLRAAMLPPAVDLHWGNLFVQDEMRLAEQLKLTAGLKVEHNYYTGWETLPNLRLAWTPDASRLLWSSLSRAVRVPSRIDRDFHLPGAPPVVNGVPQYGLAGGPDFVSEIADVLELGYRAQPLPALSWSATAYYGKYDRVRSFESIGPPRSAWRNMAQARSRGIEMWARWQLMPRWRLDGGLALQRVRLSVRPGSTDLANAGARISDPDQRWSLRSSHDLADKLQLDLMLRHVGKLRNIAVPSYTELDINLQWNVTPAVDIGITGQNLLHRRHVEFSAPFGNSQFARGVLLSATLRF
jgi:iron complex outermembrane receptor protein